MNYSDAMNKLYDAYFDYTKIRTYSEVEIAELYAKDKEFKAELDKALKLIKDYFKSIKFMFRVDGVWSEATISDIVVIKFYDKCFRRTCYSFRVQISNEYKSKKYAFSTLFALIKNEFKSRVVKAERR